MIPDRDFERRLGAIESGAERLNLAPASVHLAAEIAAFEPALDDEDRFALVLLVLLSLAALQEGSTRLVVGGEQGRRTMLRMLRVLGGDVLGPDGAEQAASRIERILARDLAARVIARDSEAYAPLVHDGPFISHQRLILAETRLARELSSRLASEPLRRADDKEVARALDDIVKRPPAIDGRALALDAEQRKAISRAATSRFTVITGGPGTGKTSIVVAIVRMLVRLGVAPDRIAMAAPTGKAAFRMSESVLETLSRVAQPSDADLTLRDAAPEALTIHRLLGYSPSRGSFRHHANNPLGAAAVIVDECSMLDLALTERLLSAIGSATQLVMLGDADQLPSVTAGAVFRDLVDVAEGAPTPSGPTRVCVRLTHNYRLDDSDEGQRSIASIASAVNRGDAKALAPGPGDAGHIVWRSRPGELGFEGVEMLDVTPAHLEAFLERWHERFVRDREIDEIARDVHVQAEAGFDDATSERLGRLFEFRAAARILCLTRVLATGTERVNRIMQRLSAEALKHTAERGGLRAGEPVMMARNDYERMLFNGDQGVVVRVRGAEGREAMMAVFRRRAKLMPFHLDALRESLELSYATTVHKAQGSEFDSVALILPEVEIPILNREILYTGLTRSRNSVVIVGSEAILGEGVARPIERHSGLRDLLLRGPRSPV